MSPPTRYSASTARPSWVSSWPASPLASVRSGWCDAVDEGDDVRADLVLEQRVGPRRGDPRGRRDEQVAVRHHHPGAPVAQLDVRLDVGRERPVPVELGLGEPSTNASASSQGPRSGAGGTTSRGSPRPRGAARGSPRRTARCSARGTRRSPRHDSICDLQEQLAVLGLQQVRHRRVLDVVDRHVARAGPSSRPDRRSSGRYSNSGGRPVSQNAVARRDEVDRGDVEQEAEAGRRCRPVHGRPRGPVADSALARHLGPVHRSSSVIAGTTAASASRSSVEMVLVDLAGPLVHEHLLELDRQRAARAVVAPLHPAAELAPAEADVLPHVERWPPDLATPEVVDEPVDDADPSGLGRANRYRRSPPGSSPTGAGGASTPSRRWL